MTSLLAIETSTEACSVAVCHHNVIQETFVVRPREHNQIMLSMIRDMLHGLHLALADLDAIAFSAGPGSFTGLRLSASIAQGLAFSAQKPVVPVSSLAVMALSAAEATNPSAQETLLAIVNAHMQDVYVGVYEYRPSPNDSELLLPLVKDALLPASRIPLYLENYPKARIIGDGYPSAKMIYPRARAVLSLALRQFAAGQQLTAEQAAPVYLRESVSWQKWQPKSTAKNKSSN